MHYLDPAGRGVSERAEWDHPPVMTCHVDNR